MMNRHHPRTLDSFKAARGKNNTQHLYCFLPPDLMTAIFVEENILRRHIHTPRNFCSREEEELRARKRLGPCCLSGHLSFNCVSAIWGKTVSKHQVNQFSPSPSKKCVYFISIIGKNRDFFNFLTPRFCYIH